MSRQPTLTERYKAFEVADAAWQKELERIFGNRAGDVRYTEEGRTGATLAPLYAEFRRTNDEYVHAQIAELLS